MSDFPTIIENLSSHYQYWEYAIGYTGIRLTGLPEFVTVDGIRLEKKDEFHITTVNVKAIVELIDPRNAPALRNEIVDEFKDFLKIDHIDKFRLSKELRFVRRGDDERTVIVLCEIPGAADFFDSLSRKYKKPLPLQPFHITLYTINSRYGIGIQSRQELEKVSEPINLPELGRLKTA